MNRSRDEILKEIKEHFSGLLDDETAELLADYALGLKKRSRIGEILSREGVITVEGVIDRIYPIRRVGSSLVATVILRNDMVIRVNLWNEVATLISAGDLFEGLKVVLRGYAKGGEINVFDVADVEIKTEFSKISSVIPESRVNLKGKISGIGIVKEVKSSRIAEIYVSDESGRIRVVLWNDKIDVYKKADIGDEIEIFNGYVKVGRDGELEVHVGRNSRVRFVE